MKKRVISMLMAMAIVLSAMTVYVSADTTGTCNTAGTAFWSLEDGALTIWGEGGVESAPWLDDAYRYDIKNVTVSEGVTVLPDYAFEKCDSLTSVTIADTVTDIGDGAFNCCSSLSSVTMPASLSALGKNAFYGCYSLTSIAIPDGITELGDCTFYGCSALESVTLPSSLEKISAFVFYDCTALTTVDNLSNCTYIGDSAFYACESLTQVTLSGATHISDRAFSWCENLATVSVNSACAYVGEDVLYGTAFYNNTSNWSDGALYCGTVLLSGASVSGAYTVSGGTTVIAAGAFKNNTALTSVTVPDSVNTVGEDAFYGTALYNNTDNWQNGLLYVGDHLVAANDSEIAADVAILSSVKSIAPAIFSRFENISSVVIPSSVSSVGENMFAESSVKQVVIQDGVTTIESCAFNHCYQLESVTLPATVTYIGDGAFNSCSKLTAIALDGVSVIGDGAFSQTALATVTIPATVTSLGDGAFYATALTAVSIPASVGTVSDNAFANSASLATVTIADGITSIGENAFSGTAVKEITVPASVTEIKDNAFADCASLTSVTLSNGVKYVGDNALYGTTITELVIPVSVVTLGSGVPNVRILYNGTEDQWQSVINENDFDNVYFGDHFCEYGSTVARVDATCTESGHLEYHICAKCDKAYTDTDCMGLIADLDAWLSGDGEIVPTGHYEQCFDAKDATCTESGHAAYIVCTSCDLTTYEEIAPLGHSEISHEGKDATCSEAGYKPYVTCSVCDYTTYEEIAPLNHNIVKIEATDGGYGTDGHKEYYTCTVCSEYFTDADGIDKIEDIDAWLAGEGKIKGIALPDLVQLADSIAVLSLGDVDIRSVNWGYIGAYETDHQYFTAFKLLCGDTYRADYCPTDGTMYEMTYKGYYRFIVYYIDYEGELFSKRFTFYCDGGEEHESIIPSVTIDEETQKAVLSFNGMRVRKVYYGYLGDEYTEYTGFNSSIYNKSDHSLSDGAMYELEKAGYYRFLVNYADRCGQWLDAVYTVYTKGSVISNILPVVSETAEIGSNTATLNANGLTIRKLYYAYIGTEYYDYTSFSEFRTCAEYTSDYGATDGKTYLLPTEGYYRFVVNYIKDGRIFDIVYTVSSIGT